MVKKILTSLVALLCGYCYHGGPVTEPNIYIDNLYTKETAKATLQRVLNMEGVSYGTYPECKVKNCVITDTNFGCLFFCEGKSGNLNVQTDSTKNYSYHQIDRAECQGDEAFLYLIGEKYTPGFFYTRPKPFHLGEDSNCQKFIDALTYLKTH